MAYVTQQLPAHVRVTPGILGLHVIRATVNISYPDPNAPHAKHAIALVQIPLVDVPAQPTAYASVTPDTLGLHVIRATVGMDVRVFPHVSAAMTLNIITCLAQRLSVRHIPVPLVKESCMVAQQTPQERVKIVTATLSRTVHRRVSVKRSPIAQRGPRFF